MLREYTFEASRDKERGLEEDGLRKMGSKGCSRKYIAILYWADVWEANGQKTRTNPRPKSVRDAGREQDGSIEEWKKHRVLRKENESCVLGRLQRVAARCGAAETQTQKNEEIDLSGCQGDAAGSRHFFPPKLTYFPPSSLPQSPRRDATWRNARPRTRRCQAWRARPSRPRWDGAALSERTGGAAWRNYLKSRAV